MGLLRTAASDEEEDDQEEQEKIQPQPHAKQQKEEEHQEQQQQQNQQHQEEEESEGARKAGNNTADFKSLNFDEAERRLEQEKKNRNQQERILARQQQQQKEQQQQEDFDDDGWKAGKVEDDFKALELAIMRESAEEKLEHAERMESLDACAAERRLLLQNMHRFVTTTFAWSLLFSIVQKVLRHNKRHFLLTRVLTLPWDMHFWMIVVAAPMIFLQIKRWNMPEPPPIPDQFKKLGPEYYRFITDYWVDPTQSCQDYVLCLAEQWTSAVKGMAFFAVFRLACTAAIRRPTCFFLTNRRTIPVFSAFTVAVLQFVTRLGAMASLFQFPKLLFELRRSQQPRPVKADVARLQQLVGSLLQWGIPVGVASDLSNILVVMSWRGLVAFFGMVVAVLSAMEMRYNPSRKPSWWGKEAPPSEEEKSKLLSKKRLANLQFFTTRRLAPSLLMLAATIQLFWLGVHKQQNVLAIIPWLQVITNGVLLAALIRPLCHLLALLRILEIIYMHDLSLSQPEIINNTQERMKRFQWRYRLKWREPQRIHTIISSAWGNFWSTWLFSDSIQERLAREEKTSWRDKLRKGDDLDSLPLWDRVQRDMDRGECPPLQKRDKEGRVRKHMKLLADEYQKMYDSGDFSASLGIAVQQRLGIGLGFMEDHARPVRRGEVPSARRLQSRAAKSSVVRSNQLLSQRSRLKKQLREEAEDANERKMKMKEFDQKMDEEVKGLAERLTNLIPTGPPSPNDENNLRMQYHEMPTEVIDVDGVKTLVAASGPTEIDPVSEKLMKWFSGKETGSTATLEEFSDELNDATTDKNPPGNHDEFVEVYLKQRFGGCVIKKGRDEEEDDQDDTKIVLA